jgi:diguanylate cyclase (GGDEF)-like protein/PAS domain S-box-containing protein
MAVMDNEAVTGVVVTAGNRPIGILTERDVLHILAAGRDPGQHIVGDIMSSPPITAPPDLDFFEAYHLCAHKNIRHLIVVDVAGELCGMVNESDFLRVLGVDVLSNAHSISEDIMNLPLLLPPGIPLSDAVKRMSEKSDESAIATVDGKPIGILTKRDVIRLGRHTYDPAATLADAMTQNVLCIPIGSSIYHAIDLMRSRRVRRLGVIDDSGRIIGLLTEHNIVRRVENHYVNFLSSIIDRQIEDINQARKQLSDSAVLTSILRESLDMGLIAVDTEGLVRYINPDAASLLGVQRSAAHGRSLSELTQHAGLDDEQISSGIKIAREGSHHQFEINREHAGEAQVLRSHIAPIVDDSNATLGFVQTLKDITEHRRAAESMRQAASIFENTVEGILIADKEGNIISVNPAFVKITGYTEDEVRGQNPRLLQSGRQDRNFYERMWGHLLSDGYWQGEIWNRRKNGEVYAEWLTVNVVREEDGSIKNFIGVFADITSLKRSQEEFEYLAHHDTLTGLPNRLLCSARLEHALVRSTRSSEQVAVMMLDLDGFKPINDVHGHDTGDGLLQAVAKRLLTAVRSEDTVARLGGDEFIIILESVQDTDSVADVALKLVRCMAEPYWVDELELRVSASIGIALFPQDGENASLLMKHADMALYQVKTTGRNGFRFYTAG